MAYTLEVIIIIASINQLETGQGMNYLINISFWTYLFLAIFMGICFAWGGIYGIISNTKKMENKVLKRILRLSVSSICIVFKPAAKKGMPEEDEVRCDTRNYEQPQQGGGNRQDGGGQSF